MRPLSLIEFQRAANHDVLPVFGSRRPADITRAASGVCSSASWLAVLPHRRSERWRLSVPYSAGAIREDLLPAAADPTFAFSFPNEARPRDRVYTNDEIRAFFAAVPGTELQRFMPPWARCAQRSSAGAPSSIASSSGFNSFEQSRGPISRDRQRTAPDATTLNNRDRMLEVKLLGSTQNPAKQAKPVAFFAAATKRGWAFVGDRDSNPRGRAVTDRHGDESVSRPHVYFR
jgi:hypothetical protein